ncbi:MAG TPA: Hsp70 family protein [Gammaproteobacteria bacterium]|nr:Hsp70 family protein [Gammaproteobacteria bacterium]
MAIHDYCGLDFGTSNSTIGVYTGNNITMVPLDQGKPIIRSAIFFDFEAGGCQFGQQGVTDYLSGVHGRLMMSLKSVLGSSLMDEATSIQHRRISYRDILGYFLQHIKQQAETTLGHELTKIVLGRPVRFHDQDDVKDRLAQDTMESVVRKLGFKTVLFQYEPIAAALTYEQTITREQLALIVDLGGGTSDFSVIRLRPGMENRDRLQDVLANNGIHIGGTDFDTELSLKAIMPELGLGSEMRGMSGNIQVPNSYYYDLTTWHTINSLYTHRTRSELHTIKNLALDPKNITRLINVIEKQAGHKVLNEVEQGKCLLSNAEQVNLDFQFIEKEFFLNLQRKMFEDFIKNKVEELAQVVLKTISDSGIKTGDIDSIFFTGGSTQIPMIRSSILEHFPNAEIVQGDVFSSVGKGLIIDAKRKF